MAQARGMTPKQQEVFDLTTELGPDAKAIAARIGTSENNVHGHLRRLRALGHLPEREAATNGGQRQRRRARTASQTPAPAPTPAAPSAEEPALLDEIELAAGAFRESMQAKLHELDARISQNAAEREEFIARSDAEGKALSIGRERLISRIEALDKADASA